MDVQELLTYIEELNFKNSMFGYDKDDVDIQLDKICDEIEAIAAKKDQEINQLRAGIVPAAAPAEDADMKIAPDFKSDKELTETVESFNKELQAQKDATAAAESRVAELQAQNAALEAKVKELDAALADAMEQLNSAENAKVNAEARADEAELVKPPQTKDEAYRQYLRNADLLCRQLDEISSKRDAVIADAQAQAEAIFSDANARAQGIVAEANDSARRINEQADARILRVEEEVRQIREEGQKRADEEQARCDKIIAQKESLIEYLNGVTSDINELIKKVQEPLA